MHKNNVKNRSKVIGFFLLFLLILNCSERIEERREFENGVHRVYSVKEVDGKFYYHGKYREYRDGDSFSLAEGEFRNSPMDSKNVGASGIPFDGRVGRWIFKYEDGNYKSIQDFNEESKRHGKFITYNSFGKVSQDADYKNGELDGVKKIYFINGNLKNQITYTNGKIKRFQNYDLDGNLSEIYDFDDEENYSKRTYYYTNGKIFTETKYENDSSEIVYKDSIEKSELFMTLKEDSAYAYIKSQYSEIDNAFDNARYIEIGEEIVETSYKDGKKILVTGWTLDGTKDHEIDFTKGLYTSWYANGQKSLEQEVKNSKLHGKSKFWDESGQIIKECTYKNNELDGNYKEWNEKGELKEESVYKNGKLSYNIFKAFDPNDYTYVKSVNELKMLLDDYLYKDIYLKNLMYTGIIDDVLMFVESEGGGIIQAQVSSEIRKGLVDLKTYQKCTVYGKVKKDMFGSPLLIGKKVNF